MNMSIFHFVAAIILATVGVFLCSLAFPTLTYFQSLLLGAAIGFLSCWILGRLFD